MTAARRASAALVTTLALFVAPATSAATLALSLQDAKARVGETVVLALHVDDAHGLGALQIELAFDAATLAVTKVEPGPLLENALIDFNTGDGRVQVAVASSDPVQGGGVLLQVSFVVKAAPGGAVEVRAAQAWENASRAEMTVLPGTPGRIDASAFPPWALGLAIAAVLLGLALVVGGLLLSGKRRLGCVLGALLLFLLLAALAVGVFHFLRPS